MTKILIAALGFLLSACSQISVQDYHEQQPKLDLQQYFNGDITGWGMVQDRSGKVLRRFTVHIDARWQGDTGVLEENFDWSDGKTEHRRWEIKKQGDRYEGTAGDVVGVAQGEAAGNALQWRYQLALPVDGKTWNMTMDDWMYLIDDQTLANRTKMSKFGVQVAEISIFFRRQTTK
jgi:hypothetical protein